MLGTTQLADELRADGYGISHAYIAYLLRERVIPTPEKGPGGVLLWSPAEAEALRRELLRRGRGPHSAAHSREDADHGQGR